jgi:hypothetical protein
MASPQQTQFEEIGKALLEGKILEEITLRGKKYKFNYEEEEFYNVAVAHGWPEEFARQCAAEYEKAKITNCKSCKANSLKTPGVWDVCPKCLSTDLHRVSVQAHYICNFTDDFCLNSGGFGSGKSIALYVKLILTVKCFPNNRVLLGRKTLSDIDRAVLPELFSLMHPNWFEHRVKDGLINFTNGSQIILFGLDAMQSGGVADIKKAQQKLKSLNLGAYFIDQLEEVEYEVSEVLNSRLRRNESPFRQGNSDCNPANFWAYHQFKLKEMWTGDVWIPTNNDSSRLYESSMLHNPNLPWDYVRKQLGMGEAYVKRFVRGNWDTSIMLKGKVFAEEGIKHLNTMARPPLRVVEGCEIYEEPRSQDYRMGIDPSEGVVDPSSISIVSSEGRKVAKWNGMIPIQGLADKVKFLYYMYNKPLIIPESNTGAALIREIRDLKVYKQKRTDEKWDVTTEKLGFRMTSKSKQEIIEHFQGLLRAKLVKIFDYKTIQEMNTFVWSDDANQSGAGASRGFHDDDIISTLLAYWDWTPKKTELALARKAEPTHVKKFQYQ